MADLVDLVETTACCERQSRFFWMVLFANSPRNFLVNLWLKCPFHELHFFFGGVLNESFVDKHLCKHSEFHTCTVESLDYRWSWVIFDDVLLIIKRGEITKQKNDIHMGWCRRKKENFVRSKNSAGGRNDTCNRRPMLAGGNVWMWLLVRSDQEENGGLR